MGELTLVSRHKMFGGYHERYQHHSSSTNTEMMFAVYLPPRVLQGYAVPVLYWLSGLACNDENFSTKAGAQRFAAEWGVALVMPDTSPRGEHIPNDVAYNLGQGAGFYLNATQSPWADHYHMYDYIVWELPQLIEKHFLITPQRSILGHGMGGHGALVVALKNADRYAAVSAFAPIVNPTNTPWGQKAFTAYLGEDTALWSKYDSTWLVAEATHTIPILIDQGDADDFYPQELQPQKLVAVAKAAGFPITFNLREGYDHSHYFIASFIEGHFAFHANALGL